MSASNAPLPRRSGVALILLFDYREEFRRWGWTRLVRGPTAFSRVPGLHFAKVMGSGRGGGFTLAPSTTHQGFVTLFDHGESARAFLEHPVIRGCRERSRAWWAGLMAIQSSRGQWDGLAWEKTEPAALSDLPADRIHDLLESRSGPLAVLTRASIRPTRALSFWKRAPDTQEDLLESPGCRLAIGLGEAPLLRQCTFSLWDDTTSMLGYARERSHQHAIDASARESYFSESMFVRMRPVWQEGHWPAPSNLPAPYGARRENHHA